MEVKRRVELEVMMKKLIVLFSLIFGLSVAPVWAMQPSDQGGFDPMDLQTIIDEYGNELDPANDVV